MPSEPLAAKAGEACDQHGIASLCSCARPSRVLVRPSTWTAGPWANAWSPEQIARRLPVDFPDDDTMRISHEAIYQAVRGRGALRRELTACLRTGRPLRTPRCASTSPKAPISACTAPRRLPPRPSPPRCARAKRDFRAAALNVASPLATADLAWSGRVRSPDRPPRAAKDGGHIAPAACRHSR